jgi:ABC-type antimicrobial peptide transport system permease subunit
MTLGRLILRNLLYFRGVNLAVIAGVAVATAVLSGALMVGDSVRGSLTDLAVQRLGKIDHALFSRRFFDASLAERIRNDPSIAGKADISPAIIVRGGAALDSGTTRTAGLQILAAGGDWAPVARGAALLSAATAEALDWKDTSGDVVFSVPSESDSPRDATLARRARQDTLGALRAKIDRVVTQPGMISLFTPGSAQRSPLNAWTNLADLQDAVAQRGRANTLFVGEGASVEEINAALRRVIRLEDYGLATANVGDSTEAAITSRTTYIDPPVVAAADQVAAESGIGFRKVSVNLLNRVDRVNPDGGSAKVIHYAVAAGISPLDELAIGDDEVAVNQWTADQLGAQVGDRLTFKFYQRQPDGSLNEVSEMDRGFAAHFKVARILPMSGVGADRSLTPTYPGLTDADSIANWDPPAEVKIDRTLVTPADEAYWKQHRAAPKVFFSFATAQRLWGESYGSTTSLRIPADRADEFTKRLVAAVDPAWMGMAFRPLRAEQIAAAGGTTDFGQLFIGFSFFIIIAAALLVAMLLRLGVEQRARHLGTMAAIGFAPRSVRRVMLAEGMMLSVCGGIIGSMAAIGYTWLMMAGLRTWWVGAIGTTAMHLHVVPFTLALGFVVSQLVALIAILWAVRQVGHAPPVRLLAGGWEAARPLINAARPWILLSTGTVGLLAGLSIIVAGSIGKIPAQTAFLAAGAVLLAAGLCLSGAMLRPRRSPHAASMLSIPRLGIRNATRHSARSVLSIGLIALAAFALVTVAAMRQGEPTDTADPHSGSGGYQLIVDSQIPLLGNPATEQGRALLGFRQPADPMWNNVEFLAFRRRAGDDVSCLNITQAINPSITAIPHALVTRGGFRFADSGNVSNPWELLERRDADGGDAIPMIADDSTAKYILHIGIGDTLDVVDASGAPRRLRLVATLTSNVFQGELLISEANFRELFPADSGFGVLLVRVQPADQDIIRRTLSDELSEYGAGVRTTASVIAGYLEVQNTYLSTFELLGALGLMLGTIGLAVVLVRTVIEREAELALLASIGFKTGARVRLVLAENVFLLLAGLVLGTGCAIIGVLPALHGGARGLNIQSLALTLGGALFIGLCASGIAVVLSSARVTPAELRRE